MISFLCLDLSHIICLTEHQLRNSESARAFINCYNHGAKFCRKTLKNGRVCIFIHETSQFTTVDLNELCKEQDLEVCAGKLHFSYTSLYLFIDLQMEIPCILLKALQSVLISLYNNTLGLSVEI